MQEPTKPTTPKPPPPPAPPSPMREGWVCPVCGAGNAPWVAQCPCAGMGPGTVTISRPGNDWKHGLPWGGNG